MDRVQPGGSCPAIFIGKFEIVTAEDGELVSKALREMSDQQHYGAEQRVFLALVTRDANAPRPNWIPIGPGGTSIVVTCGRCLDRDFLPLVRGTNKLDGPTWRLTCEDPVNIEPSVLNIIGGQTRCHYFVHGGRFELLSDSTPFNDGRSGATN